jgi:hypothetical protein
VRAQALNERFLARPGGTARKLLIAVQFHTQHVQIPLVAQLGRADHPDALRLYAMPKAISTTLKRNGSTLVILRFISISY